MKMRLTLPQEMLNKTIDVKSTGKKTHSLHWFAVNFTSAAWPKIRTGVPCAASLACGGFTGGEQLKTLRQRKGRTWENPIPGSSSSVQVGGLQVGSRVVYLDVLGISLRFGIVVSLCFFHCPQPLFGTGKDAASSRTVPC